MAKKNHPVQHVRRKGIRFQGEMTKLLREYYNREFITHSTEVADIYPVDKEFPFIFECKNDQRFHPMLLFTESLWIWGVLAKVDKEARKTSKCGIVIAKGLRTNTWVIKYKSWIHPESDISTTEHAWTGRSSPRVIIFNEVEQMLLEDFLECTKRWVKE